MSRRTLAVMMVGFFAVISCEDPLAVSDCPESVQISVSAGLTPVFDWTPRCHLVGLLITGYGATVWMIGGPQRGTCGDDGQVCYWRNTLYPPIQYGTIPRDAVQNFPFEQKQPEALRVDWPYVVTLSRAGGQVPRPHPWVAVDTFVVRAGSPP